MSKISSYSLRALFGSTIFYTVMHSIEAIVPVLLVPLLTRTLVPEEYGTWILFVSISSFLIPVVGLKLEDALRMQFNGLSHERRIQYLCSMLVLIAIIAGCYSLVAIVGGAILESVTRFPGNWFWSTVIVALLYAYLQIFLAFYQFSKARVAFSLLQLIKTIALLVFSISAALLGWSWQGLIWAKILGLGLAAIIATYWLVRRFRPVIRYSRSDVRELLGFGVRFFPSAVVIVLIPLTDNLFVANYVGLEVTGFFATGTLFASVLYIAIRGFMFAWVPWLFTRLDDAKADRRLPLAILGYYILLPIGGGILYLVSDFVAPILIGEKFYNAFEYILWMIIAMVINGLFMFNLTFIHYTKKVGWMSVCSLVAVLTNIYLNDMLIPVYGGVGAAYGTIISYSIAAGMSVVISVILLRKKVVSMLGVEPAS